MVIGQQLLLPGAVEKGTGFASETVNHMTIIDAPSPTGFGGTGHPDPGQFHHSSLALVPHQPVMVQMQRQGPSN
jgi:hypothetical protein